MSGRGAGAVLKRRILGVGFIVLVMGLIALSIAGQQHAFRDVVTIQLQTDKVGNQLAVKSDVKARGVFVGHVSQITPTPQGATLDLELTPEYAEQVPKNATARIMPKTLFGERYVSLQFEDTDGPKLSEGDVIPEDRTSAATELAESFESLLPVLQAVQPQKLNATLTAMANALEGRGEDLGKTFVELSQYMEELNPQLPALKEQFDELAKFSDSFAEVTPDIAETLDNFRTGARLLVEKRRNLADLYQSLTAASQDLETFLANNKDNIITVGKVSKPSLELLAKYSPEVPCVVNQMSRALPIIDKALGKGTDSPGLRARVVIGPAQEKYRPGQDEPRFNYMGGLDAEGKDWGTYRGPWCLDPLHPELPDPLPLPYRFLRFADGSEPAPDPRSDLDDDPIPCNAVDTFGHQVPPSWLRECEPGTRPNGSEVDYGRNGGGGAPGSNPTNTPEENALLGQLLSLQTGLHPQDMPSWGSLLVGPLYRGAEVELR